MFKRDIVICIREAGTSNAPVALPIVDGTIDISHKTTSAKETRDRLGTPQFTKLIVNKGLQESTLGFTTYIKPYTFGNVQLAELMLHESLFSDNSITQDGTNIVLTTRDDHAIKKFDIFLVYKDTCGTVFSISNAVTLSATYEFDIKGIARIKWKVVGVDFKRDEHPGTISYPESGTYILNKWTQANLDFPPLNVDYDLAVTKFTFSVINTIKFPYTERVNQQFNTASETPVITDRIISAKISIYLKAHTMSMYDALVQTFETSHYLDASTTNFTAQLGPCGDEKIFIALNNVILDYPKIKVEDISVLDVGLMNIDTATITYK